MWNILSANILFVHCTFTDFLAPSAKHFSYQLFAVIWHYSNLVYTSVLCLKSSKSILATHWNNFTWGVWLYFQTPLDWLALFPLACVRCFAATFAPPPSSGPHLHQSTRLAACTLTRSCYKLCELTILWGLFFFLFCFKSFIFLGQNLDFLLHLDFHSKLSNLQLVLKIGDVCLFQKEVKRKWWVLECT